MNNKNQYEIGKYFEREAIDYLKEQGFSDIHWISAKKPTSHFDIVASKDNKQLYIEVRYTKSKKFQITEKKLNELEKLKDVLFLLISNETKILVSLHDIKKERYVSINKGFISNLEIKKREVKGNKKSLLNQEFWKFCKMVDYLVGYFKTAKQKLEKIMYELNRNSIILCHIRRKSGRS